MSEAIIKAIVYTTLDDSIGPNPLLWFPIDLDEKIRMGVSIKAITMLTTDQGVLPKSLVIMPFPQFNLKGITKYIERMDSTRRGDVALSSITLLYEESDDPIFYKYIDYLEPAFSKYAKNIIDLENINVGSDEIFGEINKLRNELSDILKDLYNKEKATLESEAFPEQEKIEGEILEFVFKVIVCGDPGVGKTSTILRFTDNAFMRTYVPTLGVNISEKVIKVSDNLVNLILWDIAGQTKFELMRRHFYQGADIVILLFDLTKPKSIESVSKWYNDIRKYHRELTGFILGNKDDLVEERKIQMDEALKIAETLNLEYFEISALTGNNVEESFYKVVETLVSKSK